MTSGVSKPNPMTLEELAREIQSLARRDGERLVEINGEPVRSIFKSRSLDKSKPVTLTLAATR